MSDVAARILVVEDSDPAARVLIRLLRREGYSVDRAADAEVALVEIARQAPDLILLDAQLPAISGLEVCRTIRSWPATRYMPIIFLTGSDTPEQRTAAIAAGATEFVGKPYQWTELRECVRELLGWTAAQRGQ